MRQYRILKDRSNDKYHPEVRETQINTFLWFFKYKKWSRWWRIDGIFDSEKPNGSYEKAWEEIKKYEKSSIIVIKHDKYECAFYNDFEVEYAIRKSENKRPNMDINKEFKHGNT